MWEGFEICRQLKADKMTQSVPVMLITQRDNADDEVRGLELGAADCITRLRDAVADLNIPHAPQDGARRVTISVGCATAWPGLRQNYHQLLQATDNQLYIAKNAGRNCVRAEILAA